MERPSLFYYQKWKRGIRRYLIKKGAKNIGLKPVQLVHLNTEDIQGAIETEQKEGKIGEVDAPMPVPKIAYAKK